MDKGLEQIIAALRMKRAAIKNLLRNMGGEVFTRRDRQPSRSAERVGKNSQKIGKERITRRIRHLKFKCDYG